MYFPKAWLAFCSFSCKRCIVKKCWKQHGIVTTYIFHLTPISLTTVSANERGRTCGCVSVNDSLFIQPSCPSHQIPELTPVSASEACWWSHSCQGGWVGPPRRWPGWTRAVWREARRSPGSLTCSSAPWWTSGWSCGEPAGCWRRGRSREFVLQHISGVMVGGLSHQSLIDVPSVCACTNRTITSNLTYSCALFLSLFFHLLHLYSRFAGYSQGFIMLQ